MSYIYKFTIDNLKYLNLLHTFINTIDHIPDNFTLLSEDQVSIIFNEELSVDQVNTLTNYIQNYNPPQCYSIIISTETLNISLNQVNSRAYTTAITDIWRVEPDNNDLTSLSHVEIVCNLVNTSSILDNYSIRLYDAINNNVIFESGNLTNTVLKILSFSNLQNIPMADTILQLQFKVSSSNVSVNISAGHFIYSKSFY